MCQEAQSQKGTERRKEIHFFVLLLRDMEARMQDRDGRRERIRELDHDSLESSGTFHSHESSGT